MASTTGLLSQGAKLSYKVSTSYTVLDNLQEVPDLGQVPDTVDVTCLADANRRGIPGLIDFGSLEFGFLYDTDIFSELKALDGIEQEWQFELPDAGSSHGSQFSFKGVPTTIMTGAQIGDALKFKLAITVTSDVEFTAAA